MTNIIKLNDKNISKKFKKIIEENLYDIKSHPLLNEKPPIENWEYFVSEQFLIENGIENDLMISEQRRVFKLNFLKLANILLPDIEKLYPNKRIIKSGAFYYPKFGFRSWHTDSQDTVEKLYITWSSEENKSFFRYYDGEKVITDYDNKGITIRIFESSETKPYFWHCVGSECDRVSFGYRIEEFEPV
jgi:hypothetical protein